MTDPAITGSGVGFIPSAGVSPAFSGAKADIGLTVASPSSGDPEGVPITGSPYFDTGPYLNGGTPTIFGIGFSADQTWKAPVAGWYRIDINAWIHVQSATGDGRLSVFWATSEGQTSQEMFFDLISPTLAADGFNVSIPVTITEVVYLIEDEAVAAIVGTSAIGDTSSADISGRLGIQFLASGPTP